MPLIKVVFHPEFLECMQDTSVPDLNTHKLELFKLAKFLQRLDGLEVAPEAFHPASFAALPEDLSKRHPAGFWAFLRDVQKAVVLDPSALPASVGRPVLAHMVSGCSALSFVCLFVSTLAGSDPRCRIGILWAGLPDVAPQALSDRQHRADLPALIAHVCSAR